MPIGQTFYDPPITYADPVSGRPIRRLTYHRGHSNHPYFTDPCWFNGGRSFVFVSDREGRSNLFRYDLDDGKITQLTDLSGDNIENERVFDHRPQGAYSDANGRDYYWWQNVLYELDLDTLVQRTVYEAPLDQVLGIHAITSADGRYICNAMRPFVESAAPTLEYPYFKFPELFPAQPLTQIIRVEVATGAMTVIHEDRRFITHVNLSPTRPDLLTFCHEGPWDKVQQRIWGLNIESGDCWKIRPQDDGQFSIGHEYWFADGERIGYHGRPRPGAGAEHMFGHCRWDNSDPVEVRFPFHSVHFASLGADLIVGDGTAASTFSAQGAAQPYIQLFRWDGTQYTGPKILALHRCTFNHQHSHCHPRFTPDGESVLYVSDATGYANMYLVPVGDFDDLPDLADAPG